MSFLALFDVDGTLCDTQEVEGRCYAQAIKQITGLSLNSLDWSFYQEPTSSAIVRGILEAHPQAQEMENAIKREFVRLMEAERSAFPGDFSPLPGAEAFFDFLQKEKICSIAIASGGFDVEAEYKLRCCGINLHLFPHATSSDTPARKDILPLAASRAGFAMDSVVYFGDAPWDLKVSQTLGIPMIGVGRRIAQLRKLGVEWVFRDYSEPHKILSILKTLKGPSA